MAKARSKRTMRNRKSRNRRGGVFRFFISPEKKAFKELVETGNNDKLCDFVGQMINADKKDIILSQLNENDKKKFTSCEEEIKKDYENDTMNPREENPLPPRIRQQPQNGGKSRRRHRRGRTLHKRRKSRKVRKTRCRRK